MTKHKHVKTTIDINGRTYDAHTGREVSASGGVSAPIDSAHGKPKQSIDGFFGGSPGVHKPRAKPAHHSQAEPAKPASHSRKTISRKKAKHAKRQITRSRTLIRSTVSKPSGQSSVESALHDDLAKRSERAKQIQKSRLVQHFNLSAFAVSAANSADEEDQPEEKPSSAQTPDEVSTSKTASQSHHRAPHHHSTAKPALAASHSRHSSIKDFERAVHDATSHLEKLPAKPRKKHRRKAAKTSGALASVAALLLVGFFGWQNAPNLQMRLAASRADIPASLPGYNPEGFSLDGGIRSEPGKVTVSFRSDSGKSYSITEQASSWDDNTLQANYVEPRQGQTYSGDDKNIYLVEDTEATWVSGGIWYRISGTADLSADQIDRIANSL